MSERCDRDRRYNTNSCGCQKGCSNDLSEEIAATEAVAADKAYEAPETCRRRASEFSEPVCVSTNQVYDSCRDRDCVSDSRVYLTREGQRLIDRAINVKLKKAEIIYVYTNIEPLSFNNGYFSVDLKFFVCVTLEVFTGVCNPTIIRGLSTFDKRVILYGSEGNTKVFKSNSNYGNSYDIANSWQNTNMPTVVVEAVSPVALSAKIVDDCCECSCGCNCDCNDDDNSCRGINPGCMFPQNICSCFDDDLVIDDDARQVQVSYGLFTLVRLERDTQLLIDAVDFCIPTQECPSATESNPCELFNDIRFPIDEFFPPQRDNDDDNHCGRRRGCGCGCRN